MIPRAKELLQRAASNTTHSIRLRTSSDDFPAAMMCEEKGFFNVSVSDTGSEFKLTDYAYTWLNQQGYKLAPFTPATATSFLDAIGLADFAVMNEAEISGIRIYVNLWRRSRKGGAA